MTTDTFLTASGSSPPATTITAPTTQQIETIVDAELVPEPTLEESQAGTKLLVEAAGDYQHSYNRLLTLVVEAYTNRWYVQEFGDSVNGWRAYCNKYIGPSLGKVKAVDRAQLVQGFSDAGMSTRVQAAVLQVDHKTIVNDQKRNSPSGENSPVAKSPNGNNYEPAEDGERSKNSVPERYADIATDIDRAVRRLARLQQEDTPENYWDPMTQDAYLKLDKLGRELTMVTRTPQKTFLFPFEVADLRALSDGITTEEFYDILTDCMAEDGPSRENVIRSVQAFVSSKSEDTQQES